MNLKKPAKLSRYWIWAGLCLPSVWILIRYGLDEIGYGQVVHETGDWSIGLLFLTLSVTPLRRLLPRQNWPRLLMRRRRAMGVASFGYAALHTVVYLQRKWGHGYIRQEALEPGLLSGWVALAIYAALAVTSNNASVRALRGNWQRLHRLVYLAAVLVFAHWILTALEPSTAYVCAAALCLVEALRFIRR